MARPVILYRLRNGVILLGKALVRFARTWNWLIGYVDSLKGDADLNPANGHVVVDRADPDNPVIRVVNLPKGGGGDALATDDVSTEVYQHEGESTPSEAEAAAEGKLQIKDWHSGTNTGTTARTHTLGEMLAGAEDTDASTINEKMMVRPTPAEGQIPELAYRTIGALPFDGKSVEGFNDGSSRKIQVKGFSAAQTGQVPVKRNGAIAWEAQSGGVDLSDFAGGRTVVTGIEWDQTTYQIRAHRERWTYANNKLSAAAIADKTIDTTPLSQEAT